MRGPVPYPLPGLRYRPERRLLPELLWRSDTHPPAREHRPPRRDHGIRHTRRDSVGGANGRGARDPRAPVGLVVVTS